MSAMQPLCIEANRAYQATRAYSTPPVFPERDERHTTNDYFLVHLAMTMTKQHIFHAIVNLLQQSEAVLIQQCRKVFVAQVEQAAEVEVHRHLQALEHSRAAFPSPPPASFRRYLHYLQQLTEALAGRPPKGFRFAVTKAADERAPPDLDEQIYDAVQQGKLDELVILCQEWAGHPVIDAYKTGYNRRNALLSSASSERKAFLRVLIAAKANIGYADTDGWTVLHFACRSHDPSIIRLLIDEGAPLLARAHDDRQTPRQFARARGYFELEAVFKEAEEAAEARGWRFEDFTSSMSTLDRLFDDDYQ